MKLPIVKKMQHRDDIFYIKCHLIKGDIKCPGSKTPSVELGKALQLERLLRRFSITFPVK